MAHRLFSYAPPDLQHVLAGVPLSEPIRPDSEEESASEGDALPPDEDYSFKVFTMGNFIYAALDSRSRDWTNYTSASSPYQPETVSTASQSLVGQDAHLPTYMRTHDHAGQNYDERIVLEVCRVLPNVPAVLSRPSLDLPEMGLWSCAECGTNIDPWDLRLDEKVHLTAYLGVGGDCGVVLAPDGRWQLDVSNPWQFYRSVDCLGWEHYAQHLRVLHIILWYPSPSTTYKSACGYWWDEDALARSENWAVREEVVALERTKCHELRMWKAKKMVFLAQRGIHAAGFHLTRLRREAMTARENLVRDMFNAGHSIVDVGRALVARMDDEVDDVERARLEDELDGNIVQRREWSDMQERWRRMYLN